VLLSSVSPMKNEEKWLAALKNSARKSTQAAHGSEKSSAVTRLSCRSEVRELPVNPKVLLNIYSLAPWCARGRPRIRSDQRRSIEHCGTRQFQGRCWPPASETVSVSDRITC
jgi:hypothetical protein